MNLGEIKTAKDLKRKGTYKYICHACVDCGITRWVPIIRGSPQNLRCKHCKQKGSKNHMWKGGYFKKDKGYRFVYVYPDSPYISMAYRRNDKSGGYIKEHRLVMAEYLGRCLESWEIIHHKNGIRDDNRLENLELTTNGKHITDHHKGYEDGYRKGYQDGINSKIFELRKEIRLLSWKLGIKTLGQA